MASTLLKRVRSLLPVLVLALAAIPAAAQEYHVVWLEPQGPDGDLGSDAYILVDPQGNIMVFSAPEDGEDPFAVYAIPVPPDPAQLGMATTLVENDGTYSDIFGVANVGQLVLAFSSDTEDIPDPYGDAGILFLREADGPFFDATRYLHPALQMQGFRLTFYSDLD